ncbi:MAG: hypothetical protein JNK11_16730 [Alphaproteobacteria bacterium]|nr:hypothetical protein [Alphaproteobacteria bacterium]
MAPWAAATERDAAGAPLRRFIPPELYSGAPWDGSREMTLRPVDVTRRPIQPADHPAITIKGPLPWSEDASVLTLKRTRTSRRHGHVDQVFRINERGDGLGRVSDDRPGRVRRMNECFKFPLGTWSQGEVRRCRGSVIAVLEIDVVHACAPHALKFRWNDEGIYVFAPGRGMLAVLHGED